MVALSEPAPLASLAALDSTQWSALAFLTLVCSVAGYFAWNFALSRVEASRAAVCIYAEPVVAVALGILWLGERHGVSALAGALPSRRPSSSSGNEEMARRVEDSLNLDRISRL
jgi:drug/metabolite transporter (DMT)-like permease